MGRVDRKLEDDFFAIQPCLAKTLGYDQVAAAITLIDTLVAFIQADFLKQNHLGDLVLTQCAQYALANKTVIEVGDH